MADTFTTSQYTVVTVFTIQTHILKEEKTDQTQLASHQPKETRAHKHKSIISLSVCLPLCIRCSIRSIAYNVIVSRANKKPVKLGASLLSHTSDNVDALEREERNRPENARLQMKREKKSHQRGIPSSSMQATLTHKHTSTTPLEEIEKKKV